MADTQATQARISPQRVDELARLTLRPTERLIAATQHHALGRGRSVVEVTAADDTSDNLRSFVVDEQGISVSTRDFWVAEERARELRFGKLTPALYELAARASSSDYVEVEIFSKIAVPDPELPFDGTDKYVSISVFEEWLVAHSQAQRGRVAAGKDRIIAFIRRNGGTVIESARGLPDIRARVSAQLLLSQGLNADDVSTIDLPAPPAPLLGDHAGRVSMSSPTAGGLTGGACGGACDGGLIDVGLWERDGALTKRSRIARNNSRVTGGSVTGYLVCPTSCNVDADCDDANGTDTKRYCRNAGLALRFHKQRDGGSTSERM